MDIELYIKKKKKEKRFIKKGGCLLSSNRYRKEKMRKTSIKLKFVETNE